MFTWAFAYQNRPMARQACLRDGWAQVKKVQRMLRVLRKDNHLLFSLKSGGLK